MLTGDAEFLESHGWLRYCSRPPLDYPDPDSFCWEKYLEETGTSAVPTWAFKVVSRLLPSLEPSLGSCGPVSQPEEGHNQDSLPCSSRSLRSSKLSLSLESSCLPTATPSQLPGQHEAGGCRPPEPSTDSGSQCGGCGGSPDKGGSGTLGWGRGGQVSGTGILQNI